MPTQEQFEKRSARWKALAAKVQGKEAGKVRLLRKRMKRAQRRALALRRRAARSAKAAEAAKPPEAPATAPS